MNAREGGGPHARRPQRAYVLLVELNIFRCLSADLFGGLVIPSKAVAKVPIAGCGFVLRFFQIQVVNNALGC